MVGRQHIGMNRATPIGSRLRQPMEVALEVLLGSKTGLAIDSALNDVQRRVGKKNARVAWRVRCSDSQMSLTPSVRHEWKIMHIRYLLA